MGSPGKHSFNLASLFAYHRKVVIIKQRDFIEHLYISFWLLCLVANNKEMIEKSAVTLDGLNLKLRERLDP